jgi:hypothetical protein
VREGPPRGDDSNSWLPKMYTDNWTLRVGPREEGGFVKDWLYTNRNVKSPITLNTSWRSQGADPQM